MSIYVGNLSFKSSEQDLQSLFERYGNVDSVKIVLDKETKRPRGFAFVEMDQEVGQAAIDGLNGTMLDGRPIKVNEAKGRATMSEGPRRRDNYNRR
ncbi:MAG: RNA-binding protein [Candidatus Kapabacteria bacterium]|nr:RNA-binding protein [Candidatus Kapabacteria bacterium]